MLGEKKNVFFQTRLFPPCGSINITYYLMWKKILLWRSRSKPHPVWMFIYIFIYKLEIRKVSHADRHLHSPTFTVIFICVLFTLFNPVDLPFENPFFLLLQSVPIKECCGSPPGSFRVFSEAIYKPPRVDSVDWIGVGIFPCDGSKINMAKVEKEHASRPSSCLKTPSSSSKAQRTSKNEDSQRNSRSPLWPPHSWILLGTPELATESPGESYLELLTNWFQGVSSLPQWHLGNNRWFT